MGIGLPGPTDSGWYYVVLSRIRFGRKVDPALLNQVIRSRWAPFWVASLWMAALLGRHGWLWAAFGFAGIWIIPFAAYRAFGRRHNEASEATLEDIELARLARVPVTWLAFIATLVVLTAIDVYNIAHQAPSMDDMMRSQLALFRSGAFDTGK